MSVLTHPNTRRRTGARVLLLLALAALLWLVATRMPFGQAPPPRSPATATLPLAAAIETARSLPAYALPRLEIEMAEEDVAQLRSALSQPGAGADGAAGPEAKAGKLPKLIGVGRGDGVEAEVRIMPFAERSERLEAGRWPLELRVRGGNHLFGLDRFVLRAPAIRGHQSELVMLEHLRREGILTPRAFLVRLQINGEEVGLMKLHEQLAKEMVEAHERRDGALLRFGDSEAKPRDAPGVADTFDDFRARPLVFVRGRGSSKKSKSKSQTRDREVAAALVQAFLDGRLPARDVFDVELTARFLAVSELWRAVDALRWPNLRFYFNPVTKRLEPIAHAASPPDLYLAKGLVAMRESWPAALLRDAELRELFVQHARRLSAEATDGTTEAWLRDFEAPLLRSLRIGRREHKALAFGPIRDRAHRLAKLTVQSDDFGPAPPISPQSAPESPGIPRNPIPQSTREQVLAQHAFLTWDEAAQSFRVEAGSWEVEGSLVLPEGSGLQIRAGTALRFAPKEMLLASGPLDWVGTAEAPIVLEGQDEDGWQGLVVLRSERPHRWEQVRIRNTTGIDRENWKLTGGVTVRASQIEVRGSEISKSSAEDALNFIRVRFRLEDLLVEGARSDAFDGDFSSGSMLRGTFRDIGGDAIDVSGAEVTIDGTRIARVFDKAISVGEQSRLVARHVEVNGAGTAVASKDGSIALIEDSRLQRVEHAALMAYTKKSEYGRARLEARGVSMESIGRPALAQHGSHVVIDGAVQTDEELDVKGLYKRGYMKK